MEYTKLKNTKQRKCIINILENSQKPITAEEIYKLCDNVNLSTVYRSLNILAENNIVIKEIRSDKKTYYEMNTNKHIHHLVCDRCNKVVSTQNCPMEKLSKEIKENVGFEITNHVLELHGICKNCLNKK